MGWAYSDNGFHDLQSYNKFEKFCVEVALENESFFVLYMFQFEILSLRKRCCNLY